MEDQAGSRRGRAWESDAEGSELGLASFLTKWERWTFSFLCVSVAS